MVYICFLIKKQIKQVLNWFTAAIDSFKRKIQPDVLSLFTTEKFSTTSSGNACQLVMKNGQEISSNFLLPVSDATFGAVYGYSTLVRIIGDFSGILNVDAEIEYLRAIQAGLERNIHISHK